MVAEISAINPFIPARIRAEAMKGWQGVSLPAFLGSQAAALDRMQQRNDYAIPMYKWRERQTPCHFFVQSCKKSTGLKKAWQYSAEISGKSLRSVFLPLNPGISPIQNVLVDFSPINFV
jgi:hypothetical protein